jgi:hypothetical protein
MLMIWIADSLTSFDGYWLRFTLLSCGENEQDPGEELQRGGAWFLHCLRLTACVLHCADSRRQNIWLEEQEQERKSPTVSFLRC